MAVFDVRVSFVGTGDAPTPAIVSILRGDLAMEVSGKEIGKWPIADLAPARSGNSFLVSAEGESLVLEVNNPDAFEESLGLNAKPDQVEDPVSDQQLIISERTPPQVEPEPPPVESEPSQERHVTQVTSGSMAWWKFWSGQAWRDWLAKRGPWREYRKEALPDSWMPLNAGLIRKHQLEDPVHASDGTVLACPPEWTT